LETFAALREINSSGLFHRAKSAKNAKARGKSKQDNRLPLTARLTAKGVHRVI
jgi:hypothetical protein